jgi:hypothetical protein
MTTVNSRSAKQLERQQRHSCDSRASPTTTSKQRRKKKSKQCVTEPLSLLYDLFIGKSAIWNEIKSEKFSFYSPARKLFSSQVSLFLPFALLLRQILILFVNTIKFLISLFPLSVSLGCKVEEEEEDENEDDEKS